MFKQSNEWMNGDIFIEFTDDWILICWMKEPNLTR